MNVVGDHVVGLECWPTPGHAKHHVCYLDRDGTLYAGDAAGVRVLPGRYVMPPTPPPEVDVELWQQTIAELERRDPERLALIHFGVVDDSQGHLAELRLALYDWADFVKGGASEDEFVAYVQNGAARQGRAHVRLRPRDPALAGLSRPEALGRLVGGRLARKYPGVEALRDRNFRLLFAGRAISYFGTYLAPIAVAFAILDLGGSATDVGLSFAAWTIAQVSTLAFGGVIGDRLPRRAVMIAGDTASFAVRATMGVLLVAGHARIWELIALQACRRRSGRVLQPRVLRPRPRDRQARPDAAGERLSRHRALCRIPARRRRGRHDRRDGRLRDRAPVRRGDLRCERIAALAGEGGVARTSGLRASSPSSATAGARSSRTRGCGCSCSGSRSTS